MFVSTIGGSPPTISMIMYEFLKNAILYVHKKLNMNNEDESLFESQKSTTCYLTLSAISPASLFRACPILAILCEINYKGSNLHKSNNLNFANPLHSEKEYDQNQVRMPLNVVKSNQKFLKLFAMVAN